MEAHTFPLTERSPLLRCSVSLRPLRFAGAACGLQLASSLISQARRRLAPLFAPSFTLPLRPSPLAFHLPAPPGAISLLRCYFAPRRRSRSSNRLPGLSSDTFLLPNPYVCVSGNSLSLRAGGRGEGEPRHGPAAARQRGESGCARREKEGAAPAELAIALSQRSITLLRTPPRCRRGVAWAAAAGMGFRRSAHPPARAPTPYPPTHPPSHPSTQAVAPPNTAELEAAVQRAHDKARRVDLSLSNPSPVHDPILPSSQPLNDDSVQSPLPIERM